MMRAFTTLAAAVTIGLAGSAWAAEQIEIPEYRWSHEGVYGTIDRAAAQRGLQVFQAVCQSCHGLKYVYFRTLKGIGYDDDQIKALAAEYEIEDGPDEWGEMFYRPARPTDIFPDPFPNEAAARAANGGAYPPDLSVIAKGRPGGLDYIVALQMGYEIEPDGFELADGKYYNAYFPGHQISMPQMLFDEVVEYQDGTEPTMLQHAKDVAAFLWFTAEPHYDTRKEMGVRVVIFLVVLAGLFFGVKRALWRNVKKH